MSRKNLFARVTTMDASAGDAQARSDYARRGASRSMMVSIDEMAENAKRMAEGEAIVSLDPHLIDGSFVSDRLEDDEEDYQRLRDAIKAQGQSTPVLVRPKEGGRYMIVFGHRRVKVARELGVAVRAVVKNIEDIAHIVAQGQENTARANLTFIEKALFAKKLLVMGQGKTTIKSALTIDDTLLSRMLSVADTIPGHVIEEIGAVKTVGRDRWEDLKKQFLVPTNVELAKEIVASDSFSALDGVARFNFLLESLKKRKRRTPRHKNTWAASDNQVSAEFRKVGKRYTLSLASSEAGAFGEYLSANLETLYQSFKEATAVGQTSRKEIKR